MLHMNEEIYRRELMTILIENKDIKDVMKAYESAFLTNEVKDAKKYWTNACSHLYDRLANEVGIDRDKLDEIIDEYDISVLSYYN